MDFYRALSDHYDEIFPLKEPQKTFLHDYVKRESLKSVLDIGCGTGTFAIETSQSGVRVHGVDLSDEMVEISKKKAHENGSTATFSIADMGDLSSISEKFDGIFCLGNTLAHVSGEIELKQVLAQFGEKGTQLLVQTVNYDRILAKQVKELPLIKTSHLTFYRNYTYRLDGMLDFNMKIEFPDTSQGVSGTNLLFPIKCDSLKKALLETGWEVSGLWGNFDKDVWTEDSPATVLEAKRIIS
ncbi:class I SAM-dependent methyltransferase [Desulfosporosinus fructosivorans]|uniref:Class I SAM-dependent methyltransferase n=1 Tax=Desulfosporosinus fructosivorans TaxID=2018669 RepID=A0A4Z0R2D4_9FIRM|nr:class I SAM-dependent methyltransferase [Desulfosporosinus fructosivorans]TGE36918.1 class I SAM-dependent methyltransferase [Desulfosporosinus fructosivorans]